jgi:excinuclease ABC subunit A
VTSIYLNEKSKHPLRGSRRQVLINNNKIVPENWLILKGAKLHNLKNLTVEFPLGRFIAITGVSGSGKSTLIHNCLYTSIKSILAGKKYK